MVATIMIKVLVGITENSNPYKLDCSEVLAVSTDEDILEEYAKNYKEDYEMYKIVDVPFLERQQ